MEGRLRSWLALFGALAVVPVGISKSEEPLQVLIEPRATVTDVQRFGVNLGSWTTWGAEQLMANPEATNEMLENVRIHEEPVTANGTDVAINLPAWGLIVLLPSCAVQ